MERIFIEEEKFDKIDFTVTPLKIGNYESCTFSECNFYECNLAEIVFLECVFKNCNISLAKLSKTALQEVKFIGCKMMGLHFNQCNEFLFSAYFEDCMLNLSSFYQRTLKKTTFKKSILQEVDFTSSNLSGALFDRCDLGGATFENTNLEKTDFTTAFNYIIDPELNRMKKTRFSLNGIPGLLRKYDIEID